MTAREQRHIMYASLISLAASPEDKIELMRRLAVDDVFYLLVYICARNDVDRDWLFDRCLEVQADPDEHLDLWARGHYKSTIITFGLTIQEILKRPSSTIGIFSFTRPIAKAFLRQIKREFERNVILQDLFPEVLYVNPHKEALKWSEDDGIVVKRSTNPKEATLEAWGLVDGQPTSKHYSLMVYDDAVTQESVTTPEMISKVTEAWELSRNLKTQGGKSRYIGTRYHANDSYSEMINRNVVKVRLRPAEIDGQPQFMLAKELAERRLEQGSRTYACQMLLDPKADSAIGFEDSWLKRWPSTQYKGLNIYLLCDPASKKKRGSDYSAFVVYGLGQDRNYYIIDIIRDRLNLVERANVFFALHKRYRPIICGYEEYGLQADIQHYEDRMNRDNYRFQIISLGGKVAKEDRIASLAPLFEAGRIFLPEICVHKDFEGKMVDVIRSFIQEEYMTFPVGAHDDILDCMARMTDPKWTIHTAFPDYVDNVIGNDANIAAYRYRVVKQQGNYNPLTYGLGQ